MNIKHVYAVYRNSDMTEGRGPMMLDSLWWTEDGAWEYANSRLGVMGRKPTQFHSGPIRPNPPKECLGWRCQYCWPYGGEWEVRKIEVN